MEQKGTEPAVTGEEGSRGTPTSLWKLVAVGVLLVAFLVDWIGLQVLRDGIWQQAHPSPRVPQLGNIEFAWSLLALYLAMILFALSFALLARGTPRGVVKTLGWLLGVGLMALALMVPGTYFWASNTTPDEDSVVEPGMEPEAENNAPVADGTY